MTFRSNSLSAKVPNFADGPLERRPVSIKFFDLAFLFKDKKNLASLASTDFSDTLLQSELIKSLLNSFWAEVRW